MARFTTGSAPMVVSVLALVGAAIGCSVEVPTDRFACAAASECPEGWTCSGGRCHSGIPPSVDSSIGQDASMPVDDAMAPADDAGAPMCDVSDTEAVVGPHCASSAGDCGAVCMMTGGSITQCRADCFAADSTARAADGFDCNDCAVHEQTRCLRDNGCDTQYRALECCRQMHCATETLPFPGAAPGTCVIRDCLDVLTAWNTCVTSNMVSCRTATMSCMMPPG